jgi:hypothetical protein
LSLERIEDIHLYNAGIIVDSYLIRVGNGNFHLAIIIEIAKDGVCILSAAAMDD